MKLSLHKPEYKELSFRKELLSDEETMSYNHAWGGTVDFSEEKWEKWYDRWVLNPENKRFYRYLINEEGEFVGECAWHYDEDEDKYLTDVIIQARYRRQGYGSEALRVLCDKAKEKGITVLYDDIAADNPAVSVFLKLGFHVEDRTEEKILLRKDL